MIPFLLKRPLIVFMIAAMILVSGILSTFLLPIKLQPIVQEPYLVVTALTDSEYALNTMEQDISLPLEQIALQSEIVKNVQLSTATKRVRVDLELRDSATPRQIDELKENLNRTLDSVPFELSFKEVRQYSTSDQTFMQIAITPSQFVDEKILKEIEQSVVPVLRQVSGIREVSHVLDKYKPYVSLEYNTELGFGLEHIPQTIREVENAFSEPLLGTMQYLGESHRVKSKAAIRSMTELESFRLSSGETLSQLFTIKEADRYDQQFFNEMNGKPIYVLSLLVANTADEVRVSKQVRSTLEDLHAKRQTEWEYYYTWDSARFIGQAVKELVTNISLGALVAIGILFIIFRHVKTMLVIAISIPVSICTTLITLKMYGYSINMVTLIGLGLGTGMIVDACIVVLDNIFKKIEEGFDRKRAITEGTMEVASPVLSSILTTIIVFVPVAYLDGTVGAMGKELSITVIVSLLASLAVSITLIPILSYYLVQKKIQPSAWQQRVISNYEKLLRMFLQHKWKVLGSFILVLIVSMYIIIAFVPKNYVPNITDREYFIHYQLDDDVDYETSKGLLRKVAEQLLELNGIQRVFIWGDDTISKHGQIYIHYWPIEQMTRTDEEVNQDIQALLKRTVPYRTIQFSSGQSDFGGRAQVSITSPTMDSVWSQLPIVRLDLEQLQGVTGVSTPRIQESDEWSVTYSDQRLAYYQLNKEAVEQYVSLVLNGVKNLELSLDGEQRKGEILFPEVYRQDPNALLKLPLFQDSTVTLAHVANMTSSSAETNRLRRNGQYEMDLTIYFNPEDRNEVIQRINSYLDQYVDDHSDLIFTGTQQEQDSAFQNLIIAAIIAFTIVFLVLTIQFNRLRQPFMIMLCLPFTMIGVALGFIITGRVFDILAMIGVIMLVGIVVNNSIVLIDFVNKRRAFYETPTEAIIEAAKARLRPIITTSLTTIGGLIPMFIGGSYSSNFQTPIATAVIFGLFFSTLVSLLLLPIFYEWFEGKRWRKSDRLVADYQDLPGSEIKTRL